MARSQSATDIVNRALIMLGKSVVTDVWTDATPTSQAAALLYHDALDAALRAFPWNFAIRRAALGSPLADAPDSEWTYAYTLPTDPYCLRVLERYDNLRFRWVIEGRTLLTDSTDVKIRYIARIDDVSQYDALFRSAFTARLAADLAMPITKNPQIQEGMWQLYTMKLEEAHEIDSMEGSVQVTDGDDLDIIRE